jgi:isoquinoline 1-oxidoreductase alpha subunit
MIELTINGQRREIAAPGDMPLLWALRDVLGLTGTKFGCGMAQCGACTVHVDGEPRRACIAPIRTLVGTKITTIEGLADGGADHPVQIAWARLNVPQCGYCQAGQLMTAAALLARNAQPSDADIDAAMAGNLCRCGTYVRIRRAVHEAANLAREAKR